ncbi:MAG: hypothetical protein Q8876_01815 [Bacillota bacterium]|nr:hypothetical protein [Bacillota bacterium]
MKEPKTIVHINKYEFVECLLLTIYAIFGTDALVSKNNINSAAYVSVFVTLVTAGFFLINFKFVSKTKLLIFSIMCVIVLISGLKNEDLGYGYVLIYCVFLFAFLLSEIVKFEIFVDIFTRIISIIAIASLVLFFFSSIFIRITPGFLTYTNTSGYTFITLWISNINEIDPQRNYGAFWEPGAFQMYLNTALMIELFFRRKKIRKSIVIILVAAIITTYSTTGYLVAGLFLLIFVFSKWNKYSENTRRIVITSTVIAVLGISSVWALFGNTITNSITSTTPVVGKFFYSTSDKNDSVQNRLNSSINDVYVLLENPLTGAGRTNAYISATNIGTASNLEFVHNTSTLFLQGATFGIIFMLIFVIQLYKLFFKFINSKVLVFFLFISYIIMMFTEDFTGSLLLYVLFFYSFGNAKDEFYLPQKTESANDVA